MGEIVSAEVVCEKGRKADKSDDTKAEEERNGSVLTDDTMGKGKEQGYGDIQGDKYLVNHLTFERAERTERLYEQPYQVYKDGRYKD